MSVRRFQHQAGGIDWYCEQRGDGPAVVLAPSGEGDCASFDRVAASLANDFTVLTFDAPGFSRSRVGTAEDIAVSKLGDQIARLVKSLETHPATFYGCSSGGVAVLDLAVRHNALVRHAVVHEVAMPGAAALLADLATLDDAAIVERRQFLFAHMMNDDLAAWEALGEEYHARLAKNYVTWVAGISRPTAAALTRTPCRQADHLDDRRSYAGRHLSRQRRSRRQSRLPDRSTDVQALPPSQCTGDAGYAHP